MSDKRRKREKRERKRDKREKPLGSSEVARLLERVQFARASVVRDSEKLQDAATQIGLDIMRQRGFEYCAFAFTLRGQIVYCFCLETLLDPREEDCEDDDDYGFNETESAEKESILIALDK